MKYYGYKLKNTTLKDIEYELKQASASIEKIANKEFAVLLGEEAAFIADYITLGVLKKGLDEDVLEIAEDNVRRKIHTWNLKRISGKYNFSVYGYLFPHKNHVYLQVDMLNPIFKDAFDYLEDVGIDDVEMQDDSSPKRKLWIEILKENKNPISVNLTPNLHSVKAKFPSVLERSQLLARHNITNRILGEISDGNQIPPHMLMRYMDEALLKLPYYKDDIQEESFRLRQILLDFSKEENLDALKTLDNQEKYKNIKKGDSGESSNIPAITEHEE